MAWFTGCWVRFGMDDGTELGAVDGVTEVVCTDGLNPLDVVET